MKGLLKAFGLIAALFISNVQASIYNTSSFQIPEIDSVTLYDCGNTSFGSLGKLTFDSCQAAGLAKQKEIYPARAYNNCYSKAKSGYTVDIAGDYICYQSVPPSTNTQQVSVATWLNPVVESSSLCPPEQYPNYIFPFDSNGDGEPEKCFNPVELDNNSKCSDLYNSGSILAAGGNTAALVCKTFEDGSRCAFSRVEQGSTPYYQPNLEKGCFGDAEEIPDYDNDNPPSPQPEQCTPYFGGFACAADPKNYCSSTGVCVDGCGYVNDQFICFRDEECKGASCEPAPVNCETVPDAPICKDKETTPEPSFCEKNPTVESCQSGSNFCKKNPLSPSCQLGGDGTGSGGSNFVLDYDKLIQGMKDAAKTLIDETPIPDNTAMDKSLDDENKAIKSDYDNFLNDGVFSEIRNTSQRPIFSSLETLFPTGSGTCSFNFGKFSIEICSTAEKLREILYWVFSILTLIYLRHLFYQTIRTSAGK